MLGSANATVGGFDPDENNVIRGNGRRAYCSMPGASGNQVLGNQIGVDRAFDQRALFPGWQRCRGGADRIVRNRGRSRGHRLFVEQRDRGRGPGARATSSRPIRGYGVHIVGDWSDAEPGRGQLHRCGPRRRLRSREQAIPGNLADGVRIDDAPDNQVGGPVVNRRQRHLVEPGSGRLYHRGRRERAIRSRTTSSA